MQVEAPGVSRFINLSIVVPFTPELLAIVRWWLELEEEQVDLNKEDSLVILSFEVSRKYSAIVSFYFESVRISNGEEMYGLL